MRSAFSRFGLFRSCYTHSEEADEEQTSAAALCFLDENEKTREIESTQIDQPHSEQVKIHHLDFEAASNVDSQGAVSQGAVSQITEEFFDELVDDNHVIHNFFT